jgi:poly-gamma-glutamate capsule biosynthesis protein CapA/YwtB (metallophosphatase superfamily)
VDDPGAYERARRQRAARRRQRVRRRRTLALGVLLAALAAGGYAVARSGSSAPASATKPTSLPHPTTGGGPFAATAPSAGSSPPTSSSPSTGAAPPTGSVSLDAVGDTMLGNTPTLPPDPGSYFAGLGSALAGQIVFGNLEGTLTDRTDGKCAGAASGTCFAFRAPPSYARYLRRAGFTILSNANNHSFDYWQPGQDDTVRALHRAGLAQTGLPHEVTVLRVGALRVAFVGFAPYSDTGPLLDPAAAAALIHKADRMADIVVVAIHAGAEGVGAEHVTGQEETYLGEDRGNPEAFAHMAVNDGADLVLGSGPHVLRAMELYHHRLIAYSLGNFAGYHNFSLDGSLATSVILQVKLNADGSFRRGRLVSVRLVGAGQPELDRSGAGARLVATLSREDLGRHGIAVSASGVISHS